MDKANKVIFGHGERKHYSKVTEPIVLTIPTVLRKLDEPTDHYVLKLSFDDSIIPEVKNMYDIVCKIMENGKNNLWKTHPVISYQQLNPLFKG